MLICLYWGVAGVPWSITLLFNYMEVHYAVGIKE